MLQFVRDPLRQAGIGETRRPDRDEVGAGSEVLAGIGGAPDPAEPDDHGIGESLPRLSHGEDPEGEERRAAHPTPAGTPGVWG